MPISHGINIDDQGRQIMTQEVSGDAYISDGKLINPDGTQVVVIDATNTVNLTGDQTVAGVKTFSSSPIVPTATTNTEAVNKAQMDTADALKVNKAGDTITGSTLIQYAGDVLLGVQSTTPTTGKRYNLISAGSGSFGIQDFTGVKTPFRIMTDAPHLAFDVMSNGIQLNTIRILYGTGFPNGVVSAPVGSIYIDTAVTNGASSWIKKSGTGNTGWQVLEGDTGWRDIGSLVDATKWNGAAAARARRIGENVDIILNVHSTSTLTTGQHAVFTSGAPLGFRDDSNTYYRVPIFRVTTTTRMDLIGPTDMNILVNGTASGSADGAFRARIRFTTLNEWPTTLPGTAA